MATVHCLKGWLLPRHCQLSYLLAIGKETSFATFPTELQCSKKLCGQTSHSSRYIEAIRSCRALSAKLFALGNPCLVACLLFLFEK